MRLRIILIVVAVLVLGGLFAVLRPDRSDAGPQARTVDVTIKGDTMTPSEIAVTEGDQVTLHITSDQPVELHLHGYDRALDLEPGVPATLALDAKLTGNFPIENEGKKADLGALIVKPR